MIRETSPDRGVTDMVRDPRRLVTQQTDARGVVSSFTYDALGRVLTRSFPATPAQNVAYIHDATAGGNKGVGRLTQVTDASGAVDYIYDARGNVILETRAIAGLSYVTARAYDAADHLVTLTYPSGRIITYTRDGLGRVVSVSTKLNAAAATEPVASGITYAPFGPLTGFGFGNGISLSRSYDQDYRLSTLAAAGVQDLGYSHDAAGNITAITDSITPAASETLAYDDVNRLIAATGVYGTYGYAYDLGGNRISQSHTGALNESSTIALGSNRLMQISGGAERAFTYDAAGNAANDNRGSGVFSSNYVYAYSAAGDMAEVTRNGSTIARYTSDAAHLRVVRDLPGAAVPKTHFLYDSDGNLLAEHDGVSGAVLREMIWLPPTPLASGDLRPALQTGLPLGWVDASAMGAPLYFVHADHLGRPQKLTGAAGAVVWEGVFGPFGETHAITGTLAQNLRFPGQYADSETALSYNWHRSYDPALGRYLQSDPIGLEGGINTYAYVEGNPLQRIDPEGLNPAAGATMGGMVAGPPGAIVGGAIGLGLSLGAWAILNEILDGAGDPAGKANADAKTKEQCERDCDALLATDTATCNGITRKRGGVAGARCHASASQRYAACLRGQPRPPLDTWNN